MIFRRAFLLLTCCWELIRIFLSTAIFLSVLNPGQDPMVVLLFLIINSGNIIVPLYVLYEEYAQRSTAGIFFYKVVKSWAVVWELFLLLLLSSFGTILLRVAEVVSGAQFIYRILAGGVFTGLPGGAVAAVCVLDLIFLTGILLLKPGVPGTHDSVGKSSSPASLPEKDIVPIEEDT